MASLESESETTMTPTPTPTSTPRSPISKSKSPKVGKEEEEEEEENTLSPEEEAEEIERLLQESVIDFAKSELTDGVVHPFRWDLHPDRRTSLGRGLAKYTNQELFKNIGSKLKVL